MRPQHFNTGAAAEERAILDDASRRFGIVFDQAVQPVGFLPEQFAHDSAYAFDAQPALVTTVNGGIPAYLSMYTDPGLIEVLVSPMKAAQILGEAKKGDWLTNTAMFRTVENTGETSAYGDYNDNGSAGFNANFPQRQAYNYQTITQWGDREMGEWGLAKLDMVAQKNIASALVLNKFQNKTYFYGVAGLQNYGLLNDPSLSASIQPGAKAFGAQANGPWITNGVVTATANEIYSDIQSLYVRLITQSNGTIELDTPMTLAMSPTSQVALTATNSFNVNVGDLLKKNFPNIRFEFAVEYATAAGQLVQLIADNVQGQDTGTAAFNEKMRAFPIIAELSSWKQKKAQGTWGAIIYQPFAIASMLGV